MPVAKHLFLATDAPEFRKWCRFQFYDMPQPTQALVIQGLREVINGPMGQRVLAAMSVDLPGVALGYNDSLHMQVDLARQPDLLLFRFYTGRPEELLPARFFRLDLSHQALVRIMRGEQRAARDRSFAIRRAQPEGRVAPPGRLGSSSYRMTPSMVRQSLEISDEDLENMIGITGKDRRLLDLIQTAPLTPTQKAELWMSYKHQTGRRDNSPYLSCTAVMPRMVRSGSLVLRQNVMPNAPYVGLFLVPQANALVRWASADATDEESVVFSVYEVEVLYRLPPVMETFQLFRLPNPFSTGTVIPASGSPGEDETIKLSLTPDPGYGP